MGVNKIQIRGVVLNFKDEIAKVFGMEYTNDKVVRRMSEGIYSSGFRGETVFYMSNGFNIF